MFLIGKKYSFPGKIENLFIMVNLTSSQYRLRSDLTSENGRVGFVVDVNTWRISRAL